MTFISKTRTLLYDFYTATPGNQGWILFQRNEGREE